MSEARLRQLSKMYSSVTGVSQSEALRIICSTETGKKIKKGNASFLYEQQTSNLASIVAELPPDTQKKFTAQKICQSMQALKSSAHNYQMSAASEYKGPTRKNMKKLQKKRLQVALASHILQGKEQRRETRKNVDNGEE